MLHTNNPIIKHKAGLLNLAEEQFGGYSNRAFDGLDALEIHLESALKSFELNQETMRSIAGWDWIINAVPK